MAYKQQKFIAHSSGGWKSAIKLLAQLVLREILILTSRCVLTWKEGHGSSPGTNSPARVLSSRPHHPQRPHLLIKITHEFGNECVLGGGRQGGVARITVSCIVKSESKAAQSCPTLCDPMDCSLPGSPVHRVLQAGILEWVAFPSPGDLPDPGIKPRSPALQADSLSELLLLLLLSHFSHF